MSAEIKENAEQQQSQSQTLQQFLEHYGIPLLAENLHDDDYTPESLAAFSVDELQDNFELSKETAKNVFIQLEGFRKPKKHQQKGLVNLLQNLLTPTSNKLKPKSFMSAFENVTGIEYTPTDDYPMDPCSAANGATSEFFAHDFGRNFLTYKDFKNHRQWTPLMYACALRREKIVSIFLTKNPDLCVQNDVKQTALMIASCFGHVSIIDKLIQYAKQRSKFSHQKTFADIVGLQMTDESGFTALHFAVYYAQEDAVRYLLNVHANPNIPDLDGMTPTLLACTDEHRKKCLKDLINANGKLQHRNKNGQSGFDLQQNLSKTEETKKSQKYGYF
uniref:Ankyrin repeat protein n=2 Tax=Panagrolaimus superbus TaxID=310955 RepID=A0A914Y4V4_9BILA